MATYKEVIDYIQDKYGQSIKTCWIADVKRQLGLPVRMAYNRIDVKKPKYPCPQSKRDLIIGAFWHFPMINKG